MLENACGVVIPVRENIIVTEIILELEVLIL
jgi:hypothetical protein